jgi:hypothetical protein
MKLALKKNYNNCTAELQFEKKKIVQIDDVPDNLISLREVTRAFSNLGGQGYDPRTCT